MDDVDISYVVVSAEPYEALRHHLSILLKVLGKETVLNFEVICVLAGHSARGFIELPVHVNVQFTAVCELRFGIYPAMNLGMSLATGRHINFNNAGDFYLAVPKPLAEDKAYFFPVEVRSNKGDKWIRNPDDPYYLAPPHQGSFYPKSHYSNCFFNEKYKSAADLDFFFRFLGEREFKREPLVSQFSLGGVSSSRKPLRFIKRKVERCYIILRNNKIGDWYRFISNRFVNPTRA